MNKNIRVTHKFDLIALLILHGQYNIMLVYIPIMMLVVIVIILLLLLSLLLPHVQNLFIFS